MPCQCMAQHADSYRQCSAGIESDIVRPHAFGTPVGLDHNDWLLMIHSCRVLKTGNVTHPQWPT